MSNIPELNNGDSGFIARSIINDLIGPVDSIYGSVSGTGNGDTQFTGSFSGSLNGTATTASFTPNALVTASVTSNTITFTKGNGTTFPITINTGSGGSGTPGGQDTQIQFNSGSTFSGSSIGDYYDSDSSATVLGGATISTEMVKQLISDLKSKAPL